MERTRKGLIAKRRVVEAAMQVFYQNGPNKFCVADVCDYAEISRGGLNNYFRTLHDLWTAAVERLVDEFLKDFRSAIMLQNVDGEPVQSVLQAYAQIMVSDRGRSIIELKIMSRTEKDVRRPIFAEMARLDTGISNVLQDFCRDFPENLGFVSERLDLFRWWIDGYLINRYLSNNKSSRDTLQIVIATLSDKDTFIVPSRSALASR